MSDISKCYGKDCTLRNTCWRFLAPANDLWQCYADFTYDVELQECEYYWEVKDKKYLKRLIDENDI